MRDRGRTIRTFARRAGFTLAASVVILALLLFFFSMEPGERIIKGILETRISDLLGRRVVIGRLETNLFSRLELSEISIEAWTGDPPSVRVHRCLLDYSLLLLHRRTIKLSSVYIDGAVVVLEVYSSAAAVEKESTNAGVDSGLPVSVELGALRVTGSRMEYRDGSGFDLGVGGLAVDLRAVEDGSHSYRISAESCTALYDSIGLEMGEIEAEGGLRAPFTAPHLETFLSVASMDISGVPVRRCTIDLVYSQDVIVVRNAEMSAAGGVISASGRISLDSLRTCELSLEIGGIDIPTLQELSGGGVSHYEGSIMGSIRGAGRLNDPASWELNGELSVANGTYRGRSLEDFACRIGLHREMLSVHLYQDYFEVEGEVVLGGAELTGRFGARIADLGTLAALAGTSGVSGKLRLDGLLSGTLSDPVVTADFEAWGIEYLGFPVDSLSGGITTRGRSVELSGVTFSGRLDSIGRLDPALRIPELRGGFVYHGSADGAIDRIEAAAQIKLLEPSYRDMRFDGGNFAVEAEWPRIRMPLLEIWNDSLVVSGSGDMRITDRSGNLALVFFCPCEGDSASGGDSGIDGMNEAGRIECRFEMPGEEWRLSSRGIGIDMEWATSFVPDDPAVSGTLDFEMVAVGSPDPSAATLRFRAVEPFYAGASADSLRGILSLDGALLKADSIGMFVGDDRILLSGSLGLAADEGGRLSFDRKGPFSGFITANTLDLVILQPIMPDGAEVRGSLSLDLTWTGTIERLLPRGSVILDSGYGKLRSGLPQVERLSLRASVVDSTLIIENISGVMQDRHFDATGEFTLGAGRRIGMDIQIDIEPLALIRTAGSLSPDSLGLTATLERVDLALLSPYMPVFDKISGMLGVEVRAEGPPDGPRLKGHLDIDDLVLQPEFMTEPFDRGLVRVTFDREKIDIDSLLLHKGAGDLFVLGSIVHDRGTLRTIDLTARAGGLIFDKKRSHILALESVQLHYRNNGEQFLLDGDIILGETRVLKDFRPQSILPFARSIERPAKEPPEFLNRTGLDVRIRESDDVWIDNNIAKIRMRTDLGIIGTAASPNMTGRISVAKGYILYIDRKFKIEEGTLDFIDPGRLNPIVALRAVTRVTSYRATEATPYSVILSITGPLDEANVDLASDPLLDRANIISLLTLGVTREQLTGAEEGGDVSARSVLVDRAKALTSERVGGYVSRNVEDLFRLDQMTIEGNLFDFGSSWGPQLLASKRISDRTTLTYKTNVGHLNERSIMLDYRLTRGFSLSGETDQYGRSGIDLKYTIRLK